MKYLILLSGKLSSGKNQFAKYLEAGFISKGLSVKQDLYAYDLKQYSSEDFKLLGNVLKHKVDQVKASIGYMFNSKNGESIELQNSVFGLLDQFTFTDENFWEDKTDITRVLLQLYGTDIARKRFDDLFWIKKLGNRINDDKHTDVVIITDVRFANEIEDIHEFVKDRRIIPVRINRDMDRNDMIKQHISETALDDYNCFEYIISNDSTLDDLFASAHTLIDDIIN